MRLRRYEELEDHCAYEFAPEHVYRGREHWQPEYRYLPWEEFGPLAQALLQIIPNYNEYGPEKLTLSQWDRAEAQCLGQHPEERAFFDAVRRWLDRENRGADTFWILGP